MILKLITLHLLDILSIYDKENKLEYKLAMNPLIEWEY